MASSTAQAPQGATEWGEAECKSALAHLEKLQQKLDDLRLTIPRIVEPLNSPHSSSSSFYQAFKKSTVAAVNDIKIFRTDWHSQNTQTIFNHTRESHIANPDLSVHVKVPKYGWIDSLAGEKGKRSKDTGHKAEILELLPTEEDITSILEDFRKAHPDLDIVSSNAGKYIIDISLRVGFILQPFRIVLEETNGRYRPEAECLGSTRLAGAVTRCLASRSQANDLEYLLDMVAAYQTTNVKPCAKCSEVLDKAALPPTARRSKEGTNTVDNTTRRVWEPFHESCCLP